MKSSGGLIELYKRPHTKNKASIKGTSRDPGSDEHVLCLCVYVCVSKVKSIFQYLFGSLCLCETESDISHMLHSTNRIVCKD